MIRLYCFRSLTSLVVAFVLLSGCTGCGRTSNGTTRSLEANTLVARRYAGRLLDQVPLSSLPGTYVTRLSGTLSHPVFELPGFERIYVTNGGILRTRERISSIAGQEAYSKLRVSRKRWNAGFGLNGSQEWSLDTVPKDLPAGVLQAELGVEIIADGAHRTLVREDVLVVPERPRKQAQKLKSSHMYRVVATVVSAGREGRRTVVLSRAKVRAFVHIFNALPLSPGPNVEYSGCFATEAIYFTVSGGVNDKISVGDTGCRLARVRGLRSGTFTLFDLGNELLRFATG